MSNVGVRHGNVHLWCSHCRTVYFLLDSSTPLLQALTWSSVMSIKSQIKKHTNPKPSQPRCGISTAHRPTCPQVPIILVPPRLRQSSLSQVIAPSHVVLVFCMNQGPHQTHSCILHSLRAAAARPESVVVFCLTLGGGVGGGGGGVGWRGGHYLTSRMPAPSPIPKAPAGLCQGQSQAGVPASCSPSSCPTGPSWTGSALPLYRPSPVLLLLLMRNYMRQGKPLSVLLPMLLRSCVC